MSWEAIIGLEVHVQLATKSKAFSASSTAFGGEPNSQTDPTVLGLPGALPVFNRQALDCAILLGVAVGGTVRENSRFARKQYFYPDLPKGYQISQFDEPIIEGGFVEFSLDGKEHKVELTRIHLEEDAGKSTHRGSVSLIDLNRAGVPLCEVVSEPVIRSSEEAAEYMRALWRLVRYLGICEGNMEQGHLRCDANVSLRRAGDSALGTRTELKNINSFRFVRQAIDHEIARQTQVLDSGGSIVQETLLWDADSQSSQSMRSKEEAEDYRYFPDPDLPPLRISAEAIASAKASLPELPEAKRKRYLGLGLAPDDAAALSGDRASSEYFDTCVLEAGDAQAKTAANWILSELLGLLHRENLSMAECPISPSHLAELIALLDKGTISGKIAKTVFAKMFESNEAPGLIVEREGLLQISDTRELEELVRGAIEKSPKQVEQYRSGNQKIIGYFVGQIMKQTQGKANPKLVNELLRALLKE